MEYTPKPHLNDEYENQTYSFLLKINLRGCYPGEIYNNVLHVCSECPFGRYSFNPSDKDCQICPREANFCYKNITDLKPGFWRSLKTSKIFECDVFAENCL